ELAAQVVEEAEAVLLVEVDGDLAVAAGAEAVTAEAEVAAEALVIVELAVDGGDDLPVLAGDGLRAAGGVEDGQADVGEADPAVLRQPGALAVGPAVADGVQGPAEGGLLDPAAGAVVSDDPAHARPRGRRTAWPTRWTRRGRRLPRTLPGGRWG